MIITVVVIKILTVQHHYGPTTYQYYTTEKKSA